MSEESDDAPQEETSNQSESGSEETTRPSFLTAYPELPTANADLRQYATTLQRKFIELDLAVRRLYKKIDPNRRHTIDDWTDLENEELFAQWLRQPEQDLRDRLHGEQDENERLREELTNLQEKFENVQNTRTAPFERVSREVTTERPRRSEKLAAPPAFQGTEGPAVFCRWRRQILEILEHNADRYNTEASRRSVVYSNTAGAAQDQLEAFLNSCGFALPTAQELIKELTTSYDDPLAEQRARQEFRELDGDAWSYRSLSTASVP